MRIAVVSDIHGNLVALNAVLADIHDRSPDVVINLGDVATGPLWPRETYDRVSELRITAVRGNHDRWLAEGGDHDTSPSVQYSRMQLGADAIEHLAALPGSVTLDGDVLAVHGTPSSDVDYMLEQSANGILVPRRTEVLNDTLAAVRAGLVLCGHSHRAGIAALDDCLIVNPGAVGGPRFADNEYPRRAEAGVHHACYAIATRIRGLWCVNQIALPYDWDAVVARARANGRDDWAAGFFRRR